MNIIDNKLGKNQRLCNKPLIDTLFVSGNSVFAFPFRCVYMVVDAGLKDGGLVKILVSVSKRNHKKAVSRNLIKRRIREAYRLNKQNFAIPENKQVIIAFIYTQKTILDYTAIENGVKKGVSSIKDKFSKASSDFSAAIAD